MMAALAWSRSWQVSTISASAPPRSSASALSWYVSRNSRNVVWPSVGSLVPGPAEPGPQPVGQVVLAEIPQVRAERVGGDAIRARGQIRLVDRGHDVGPGHVQDL